MTSEEFEEISHECGYRTKRVGTLTICQALEGEFWMAVYEQGKVTINEDFIYNSVKGDFIMPVRYKVYKQGMRKKIYRNYLLQMERKYKYLKVEQKKYHIEKDFE